MEQTSETALDKRETRWIISFSAILFAFFAVQMSSLGFSPLVPAIQHEFRMSYSQLGLFTGLYGVWAVAVSVPAGLLARRFGERVTILAGLIVVALGLACLSLAAHFATALVSRSLWLIGYRTSFVCIMTAVAITCPPKFKGKVMGICGAVASLASVIGAPFGGIIARHLGWRGAVLAFGGMAAAGAIVLVIFYRNAKGLGSHTGDAHGHQLGSTHGRPAHRFPVVWAFALLLGCCNTGGFSITFFVPAALHTQFGFSTLQISYLISQAYLFAIIANLAVGALMDFFNRWTVMISVAILSIMATVGLHSSSLLGFRIAVVLVIALGLVAANQVFGLAGELMAGRNVGPVMGIVSLGTGVFGFIGPQALGVLRDRTGGFSAGWWLLTGAALVTLVELLILRRNKPRDTPPVTLMATDRKRSSTAAVDMETEPNSYRVPDITPETL